MGAGVAWGVSCSVKAGAWIWGKDIPDRAESAEGLGHEASVTGEGTRGWRERLRMRGDRIRPCGNLEPL